MTLVRTFRPKLYLPHKENQQRQDTIEMPLTFTNLIRNKLITINYSLKA